MNARAGVTSIPCAPAFAPKRMSLRLRTVRARHVDSSFAMRHQHVDQSEREVSIKTGSVELAGDVSVPAGACSIVLFAHGSGSSRRSSRNVFVARALQRAGLATLLFDLLTRAEEKVDVYTREYRFDIPLLARRLEGATQWLEGEAGLRDLVTVYFGASTGSAAALIAASRLGERVGAIVSRGGRPDLAADALPRVTAPTLLIVGGDDTGVIELNEQAFEQLTCEKELQIIPGASHLFEEPGTLETVASLAADWFSRRFRRS
jgi:putative phosphoribosyl transferase